MVGLLFLPAGSEHPAGRFDLPGFLLAGAGFPLFMYALSTGASRRLGLAPRCSAPAWPAWRCSPSSSLVERRAAEPLLRLRLYRDGLFRITSLQATAASGGFIGTLFLVPLLLQNGLGFSAVHSGLSTFTEALGGMTGVQITTRLYKRTGPRRLMIAGMCGAIASIGLMALAGPSDAYWLIPLLMFCTGCSFGFAMSPGADRQHGHDHRGGDRARLHAGQHRQAGGRRRRASRCSAPWSPRPARARPTWPATSWRSSPRPA